jgi:hypothetical protein
MKSNDAILLRPKLVLNRLGTSLTLASNQALFIKSLKYHNGLYITEILLGKRLPAAHCFFLPVACVRANAPLVINSCGARFGVPRVCFEIINFAIF